jgi:hypothetical protein
MAGYVADSIIGLPLAIRCPSIPMFPITRLPDKATKSLFLLTSLLLLFHLCRRRLIVYASSIPSFLIYLPLSQQSSCRRSTSATIFSLLRKLLLGVIGQAANSPVEICHTQTTSTRLTTPTWSRLVTSSVLLMGTFPIETILRT